MNKNSILKIARTIYLQNIIARQLFSAYNPFTDKLPGNNINNILNDLDEIESIGSYAGQTPSTFKKLFSIFIGSDLYDLTGVVQFIKKEGNSYKFYPFDSKGNVIENENTVIKTFNNLPELLTFCKSNGALTTISGNSLSQAIRQLHSLMKFEGVNAMLEQNTILKQHPSSEEDKLIDFKNVFWDIINKWVEMLNNQLTVVQSFNGLLPIIFNDQIQLNTIKENINNLRKVVIPNIIKYSNNFINQCNEKNIIQKEKTYYQNMKQKIENICNYLLSTAQVENLMAKVSKVDASDRNQKNNLSANIQKFSNVFQYLDCIQLFIEAIRKLQSDYQKAKNEDPSLTPPTFYGYTIPDILDNIQTANTNKELDDWARQNIKDIVNSYREQLGIDSKTNNQQSLRNTFIGFLVGRSDEGFRPDSWNKIYNQLVRWFYFDPKKMSIIESFNNYVNFVVSYDFKDFLVQYLDLYAFDCQSLLNQLNRISQDGKAAINLPKLQGQLNLITEFQDDKKTIDDLINQIDLQCIDLICNCTLPTVTNKPINRQKIKNIFSFIINFNAKIVQLSNKYSIDQNYIRTILQKHRFIDIKNKNIKLCDIPRQLIHKMHCILYSDSLDD